MQTKKFLNQLERQFQLFSTPFAEEIDNAAEELQMGLVEQCDSILKQNYAELWIPELYSYPRFVHEKGFLD